MNIQGPSAGGVASAVWTNPTRTLTSLVNGGAISFPQVTFTSIPAAGTVDLRPAASSATLYTVTVAAGTALLSRIRLTDGTNFIIISTVAAGSQAGAQAISNNSVWLNLQNGDNTNAASYMASGINIK
jgi:hypothetical protein